jgi:hypothetical protein
MLIQINTHLFPRNAMRANSDRVFAALPHSTEEIEGYRNKGGD